MFFVFTVGVGIASRLKFLWVAVLMRKGNVIAYLSGSELMEGGREARAPKGLNGTSRENRTG